jgi:hypothetical protein
MSNERIAMLTCLCGGEPYLAYHEECEYIGRCCAPKCDVAGQPSTDCEKETAKQLWNDMILAEEKRILELPYEQ